MHAAAEMQMPGTWNFGAIYREHHRRVLNLCAYLLKSRDAAEDAAHDIFLRAHHRIDSYDPALSFSNWILKMASNYCIDILRRRGKEKRLFGLDTAEIPDPSSGQPTPLGEVLTSEEGAHVRRALLSLPDKFRIPLVLSYYNDMKYEEIAAAMQIPRNTVATLLFRGKQLLREKLKKEKCHDLP
jgi:RNA polymerase sigma-70 factor, ECF subfamily